MNSWQHAVKLVPRRLCNYEDPEFSYIQSIERVHEMSQMRRSTKTCGENVWHLYYRGTKMWCIWFYRTFCFIARVKFQRGLITQDTRKTVKDLKVNIAGWFY